MQPGGAVLVGLALTLVWAPIRSRRMGAAASSRAGGSRANVAATRRPERGQIGHKGADRRRILIFPRAIFAEDHRPQTRGRDEARGIREHAGREVGRAPERQHERFPLTVEWYFG